MTQYLILIYDGEAAYANATPERNEKIMAGHQVFGEKNDEVYS